MCIGMDLQKKKKCQRLLNNELKMGLGNITFSILDV